MARLVLDSSIWAQLQRSGEKLENYIDPSDYVYLPAAVLAELKVATKHRARTTQQRKDSDIFVSQCLAIAEFWPSTEATAEIYAELAAYAMSIGRPRGVNDLWIAAAALEVGAELKSLDRRAQFEGLPGLILRD